MFSNHSTQAGTSSTITSISTSPTLTLTVAPIPIPVPKSKSGPRISNSCEATNPELIVATARDQSPAPAPTVSIGATTTSASNNDIWASSQQVVHNAGADLKLTVASRISSESSSQHPSTQTTAHHDHENSHISRLEETSRVIITPLESTTSRDFVKEGQAHDSASPLDSIETIPTKRRTPPFTLTVDTGPSTTSYIPPSRENPKAIVIPPKQQASEKSWATAGISFIPSTTWAMLTGTKAAHRRRNMANTSAITDFEADMTNKDRLQQKEAIRRYLDENIKEDWNWKGRDSQNGVNVEFADVLGQTGRTAIRWQERDEWQSNTNDSDDEPAMPTAASPDEVSPTEGETHFPFESPDDVGEVINRQKAERKRRRERKLKEEMAYNEGLRCFEARRNAWTGARQVPSRKLTKTTSQTLSSIVNLESTHSNTTNGHSSPTTTTTNTPSSPSTTSSTTLQSTLEIPIAPPLLPPTHTLRSKINPTAYNTIYDKIILQSQPPTFPIPLQHVLGSCVQGWKRDGLWAAAGMGGGPEVGDKGKDRKRERGKRKLSVAGIFGLGKEKEKEKDGVVKDRDGESMGMVSPGGGGIRKSFQRLLNLGSKDSSGGGGGLQSPTKSQMNGDTAHADTSVLVARGAA